MRRVTLWVLSTVVAVVLLFSYRTSTMGPGGGSTVADGPGLGGGDLPGGPGSGGGSTGGDASGGGGGGSSYDGSVAQTRWGPVQVRITVSGGKITDVTAIQAPDGNRRDRQINGYALPILRREVLAAQSAQIETVSGATVTSGGYVESLQAALDAAHLR